MLQLRDYQQACLDHAQRRNTIVCLPTGKGKTLIAVKLVDEQLRSHPSKKIGLLVPTRPLAQQQADYIAAHPATSANRIQKLVGVDQADWLASDWRDCLRRTDVFVGTAEVFKKALVTDRLVSIEEFSLLIFDECHNAVGNSPMACVLHDAVAPYYCFRPANQLRILGLTASFINGNLKNMAKKRRDLEGLMQSTIFCPDLPNTKPNDMSRTTTSGTNFMQVDWSTHPDMSSFSKVVVDYVEGMLSRIGPARVKEIKKVVNQSNHVFQELGYKALIHFVDKTIAAQLEAKVSQLSEDPNDHGRSIAARSLNNMLPVVQEESQALKKNLQSDSRLRQCPPETNKLDKLVLLLRSVATDYSYRGIVFVERVALVTPLTKHLNDQSIETGAVAGVGHQSDRDRQTQLDDFRLGKIRILVSTSALEEGIDVPECGFVVRFNTIATTKAHIQGSGRARHDRATVYYFANNPTSEQEMAARMFQTAKDCRLSLSQDQLKSSSVQMAKTIEDCHPYPFHALKQHVDGLVTIFNCKTVLNDYCCKVLGQSISPQLQLYNLDDDEQLQSIRVPSPNGWRHVTSADVVRFWSGVDWGIIFPAVRCKNMSTSDKQGLLFVYVAVVALRDAGWLDLHNRAAVALLETRRLCPLNADRGNMIISLKTPVLQSRSAVSACRSTPRLHYQ